MSTLVHIGYHKTGSTWLQRRLFVDESTRFAMPWTWGELMQWLVRPDPLEDNRAAIREFFRDAEQTCLNSGRIAVASAERLSGMPFAGGYDRLQIAENIKAAFPDAKILIVVREQRSVVLSVYKQYVRNGGASSLKRFVRPPRSGDLYVPLFDRRFYEYDRLVARYQSLFGNDAVLVLAFEQFRADLHGFVKRVVDFTGASMPERIDASVANPALSGLAILLRRPANWLLARSTLNPTGLIDSPKFNFVLREAFNRLDLLTPKRVRRLFDARAQRFINAEFAGYYKESNHRLHELTGLDLGALGYDV